MDPNVRHLSDKTKAKIRLLFREEPPPYANSRSSRIAEQRRVLIDIASTSNVAVIPYISSFLLQEGTQLAATYCITSIMRHASTRELLWLHETRGAHWQLRSESHPNYRLWKNVEPAVVHKTLNVWILGLFSFHPNGFVREAALTQLAKLNSQAVVAFLLIRANDWVLPIRHQAKKAIKQWLKPARLAAFALYLPLVQHLRDCERTDHVPMVNEIEQQLLASPHSLEQGFHSPDRYVRRSCLNLRLRTHGPYDFLEANLSDSDIIVRVTSAKAILQHSETRAKHINVLTRNHLPQIRSLAADALAESTTPSAHDGLQRLAFDPSTSVRQTAQYWLRKNFSCNLRNFYLVYLTTSSLPDAGAFLGLAETGQPSDGALLSIFLKSGHPHVRRSVLRALDILSPQHYRELFYYALWDLDRGVSKIAYRTLAKRKAFLDFDKLKRIAVYGPEHSSEHALLLMARTPGWLGITHFLATLRSAPTFAQDYGLNLLARWSEPDFFCPSEGEKEGFLNALDGIREILPPLVYHRLQTAVHRWD